MDLVKELEKIEDPVKDHGRLLGNLYYTHFCLLDKYKAILSGYGITLQQANALSIVKEFHPSAITLTVFKSGMLEKNADASRIIQRLSAKGLLKRTVNKHNRRKIEISLTAKGMRLAEKIEKDARFSRFTSGFSLEEAKLFTRLLSKLRGEVGATSPAAM